MKNQKKKSFPRRVFLCLLAVLLAVCIAFGIYVSDYYHADPAAEDAMVSDDDDRSPDECGKLQHRSASAGNPDPHTAVPSELLCSACCSPF